MTATQAVMATEAPPAARGDKRRAHRLNLYLPVSVAGRDARGGFVEERTVTVNVSVGGAYFISGNIYSPGDSLSVTIALPHYPAATGAVWSFRARAEVVRAELFRSREAFVEGGTYGIAVRFTAGARFPLETAASMAGSAGSAWAATGGDRGAWRRAGSPAGKDGAR